MVGRAEKLLSRILTGNNRGKLCGIFVESLWNLCGIFVESLWNLCAFVSLWHLLFSHSRSDACGKKHSQSDAFGKIHEFSQRQEFKMQDNSINPPESLAE
jgi:hypothetical protein